MIITIDGPAGVGKSSLCSFLSNELNFLYLNSGEFYRLFTYFLLKNKLSIDKDYILSFIQEFKKIDIKFLHLKNNNVYYIKNYNLNLNSLDLRDDLIDKYVSTVAQINEIREIVNFNLKKQNNNKKNIIVDGRDASIIFPEAKLKIYLDASIEIRTLRRLKQYNLNENEFDNIKNNILLRDKKDKKVTIQSEDNLYIDTSDMSFLEVKNKLINIIGELNEKKFQ